VARHVRKVEDLGYSTLFLAITIGVLVPRKSRPTHPRRTSRDRGDGPRRPPSARTLSIGVGCSASGLSRAAGLPKKPRPCPCRTVGWRWASERGGRETSTKQGVGFDRQGRELAKLAEVVYADQGALGRRELDYAGQIVQVRGLRGGRPRPVQRQHPPIMIGRRRGHGCFVRRTGGRHRSLSSVSLWARTQKDWIQKSGRREGSTWSGAETRDATAGFGK